MKTLQLLSAILLITASSLMGMDRDKPGINLPRPNTTNNQQPTAQTNAATLHAELQVLQIRLQALSHQQRALVWSDDDIQETDTAVVNYFHNQNNFIADLQNFKQRAQISDMQAVRSAEGFLRATQKLNNMLRQRLTGNNKCKPADKISQKRKRGDGDENRKSKAYRCLFPQNTSTSQIDNY